MAYDAQGNFTPGNPAKKETPTTRIPMHVILNDREFEKFFKCLMDDILKGKTRLTDFEHRNEMDSYLRRGLVRGGLNEVNFYDKKNQFLFDEMINDIWESIKPTLKRKVLQHGSKFTKTI